MNPHFNQRSQGEKVERARDVHSMYLSKITMQDSSACIVHRFDDIITYRDFRFIGFCLFLEELLPKNIKNVCFSFLFLPSFLPSFLPFFFVSKPCGAVCYLTSAFRRS